MIEKSHLALWPDRTLTRFAAATSQIWEYARVWVFWSLQSASWNNSKVSKSRPAPGHIPCECRLRQSCLAQPKRPTWLCHCRWSGRRGGSPEQQVLYKIKFSGCSLLMQMWHLAGAGWPEVDTGSKSNAQHILTTPVHLWFWVLLLKKEGWMHYVPATLVWSKYQIEIEVVLQLWGIENFERDFGDLARSLPRTPE